MKCLALLVLLMAAVPAAAQDNPNPIRRPAPDFLLEKPRGTVTLRGSWLFNRGRSDWYDFVTNHLTLDQKDFNAPGFGFDVNVPITSRLDVQVAFDNMTTVYGGGFGPYDANYFNTNIKRFAATPDARNYLNHWFEPSGNLQIPLLTLHTMWDPAVPTAHERKLASVVAAAGNSEFLRQNTGSLTNAFNHCGFSTAEIVSNFDQLAAWVATGE